MNESTLSALLHGVAAIIASQDRYLHALDIMKQRTEVRVSSPDLEIAVG